MYFFNKLISIFILPKHSEDKIKNACSIFILPKHSKEFLKKTIKNASFLVSIHFYFTET
jgi:hypothetical protein